MKYFFIFIIFYLYSCTNPKSVLICGDHECINKAEAKQYFNDNLSIEVKVISKEKESRFDLVKLNINSQKDNSIAVLRSKNKKIIKKLTKKEILDKKKEIKKKKKIAKLNKEKIKKNNPPKKSPINVLKNLPKKNVEIVNLNKSSINRSSDICLKVKKCDIDSITKYLIKLSNKKEYPNINLRN